MFIGRQLTHSCGLSIRWSIFRLWTICLIWLPIHQLAANSIGGSFVAEHGIFLFDS
jgi:hypothetical protein